MFRNKIKQAYDKTKGDGYCYIEDVEKASGLQADLFLLCLKSLAGSGVIELQTGFEFWNDKKTGYQVNSETFFGMVWQSEYDDMPAKENTQKSAFERLYDRVIEISAIMECTDKKKAVQLIKSEFPEFDDISDNTIKQNITSFPFLSNDLVGLNSIKQQLNTVSQAKDRCLNELDSVKQELNTILNKLETTEQQLKNANHEIVSLKQELNTIKQAKDGCLNELDAIKQQLNTKGDGMTELNKQLNNFMDTDKIAIFMQETEQRFDELNNRIKQFESNEQEIKQIKQSVKQRGLNNVGKWNIVESGGYYRAFRNIDGKNVGVYIGKEFSEQLAKEKIQAKGYPLE